MYSTGAMDTLLLILVWFVAVANAISAAAALRTVYVTHRVDKNMALVERATNSMKDALVAATQKSAYMEGENTARVAGEAKAATLAEVTRSASP